MTGTRHRGGASRESSQTDQNLHSQLLWAIGVGALQRSRALPQAEGSKGLNHVSAQLCHQNLIWSFSVRRIFMNLWLAAASLVSAVTCGLHVFMGGKEAAGPLLKSSELDPIAKFTNYYCWHLVTIVIAGLAVAFAYSCLAASGNDVALLATALAALFAAWSVGMIAIFRLPPLQFAQWALFLPISLLGLIGSLR
ncbi:hypothetical protein [Diaphorobacter aerolatus]|uniref:Uncharacterized protein n=1 Tax=Diaphorobacter aerolatus TaxID=1288495 RepID=A0A7H0GGI6_9BURK|nr:hypothetical protein [Diaphorobacter aerolatus]QNP47402.1 hypothetical protein H9K75_13890 [Diaphorobacter aerolatus]